MRDKQEIRLDILSGIDEEIVNRNTYKRMKLMNRGKSAVIIKRRVLPIVAAAACFCIILSALFMILLGGKEVPVYTGMTASSTPPIASAKADGLFGFFSLEDPRYAMLDNSNKAPNLEGNNGNHNGQMKDAVDRELEKHTQQSTLTVGENNEIFYANANETVYITIHFNNPDAFEILSFVFNGQKYTSYMFEEGSTLENIVIKINVGDTAGLMKYTIDAIKYVDGTEIKDVKIGGDQTISIGVYSETLQPKPIVTEEAIDYNSISFKAEITDSFGLVEKSEGKLDAMLYDGEEIVGTQELTVGEVIDVRFEGLITGKQYHYAIVGVYDAYDKQGPASHILYSQECSTKTIFSFTEVTAETESISFSMLWDEAFENKTITSLALYKGEEKICDIDPNTPSIDGLLSNCEYTLVAEYINKGAAEKVEYKVKTAAKAIPEIKAVSIEVPELTSLKFSTGVTDKDNVGRINAIELLCDGERYRTLENLEEIVLFERLEFFRIYTLKIVYLYDLNDGKGEQTMTVFSDEVNLQSKGLDIQGDIIYGLGTCTDTELYINMPMERSAFEGNKSIEKVHFGNGVTEISNRAFYECTGLTEINIPEGVTRIGEYAFYCCSGLTEIDLPESIVEIGGLAFYLCSKLEIANIPSRIKEIPPSMFAECNLQSIIIPQGVTSIGNCAFSHNPFKNINIPDSVISIGELAFECCEKLESINIPDSVETIGPSAFQACSSVTEIRLSKSLKIIEDSSFRFLNKIEELIIPEGVTVIKNYAFGNLLNLKSLTLPRTLTSISENAFEAAGSFSKKVNVHISEYDTWLNNGFVIKNGGSFAVDIELYIEGEHITDTVIPNNITKIRDYAFYICRSIKSITIPEGVTSVGQYAFNGCESLKSITLPASVTSIGINAFEECETLESVTVLGNVSVIDENIFKGCSSLKDVYLSSAVTRIRAGAFTDCGSSLTLHFDGTKEQWNKVVLVDGWRDSCVITVKCSDGDITYNYN